MNGYVWICAHISSASSTTPAVSITRLEDSVPHTIYSRKNDFISPETRREITRLVGCVKALVQGGVRVDEDTVMKAYEVSLDLLHEQQQQEEEDEEGTEQEGDGGESRDYLGGRRGARVVESVVDALREGGGKGSK